MNATKSKTKKVKSSKAISNTKSGKWKNKGLDILLTVLLQAIIYAKYCLIITLLADSSSSLDESAGSDGPLNNERIKDIKIIEPKVEPKSPKPGDKNKMKEAELRKSIKDKLHTGGKEYVQTKHLSDTRPVVSSLLHIIHLQRRFKI